MNTKTSPTKAAPASKKSNKKIAHPASWNACHQEIKTLGTLHFVGNILSGGTLGLILILAYLFIRQEAMSAEEKATCYEIINFNISFILYSFVAGILMIVLIGFILFPMVWVAGMVLLVIGFIRHLHGENYQYPGIIRLVK